MQPAYVHTQGPQCSYVSAYPKGGGFDDQILQFQQRTLQQRIAEIQKYGGTGPDPSKALAMPRTKTVKKPKRNRKTRAKKSAKTTAADWDTDVDTEAGTDVETDVEADVQNASRTNVLADSEGVTPTLGIYQPAPVQYAHMGFQGPDPSPERGFLRNGPGFASMANNLPLGGESVAAATLGPPGPCVPQNPLAISFGTGSQLYATGYPNNGLPELAPDPRLDTYWTTPGELAGTYTDPITGVVYAGYTQSMPDPVIPSVKPIISLGEPSRALEMLTGVPGYAQPQRRKEMLRDFAPPEDNITLPAALMDIVAQRNAMADAQQDIFLTNNTTERGMPDVHWDGYLGDMYVLREVEDTQTLQDNDYTNTIVNRIPSQPDGTDAFDLANELYRLGAPLQAAVTVNAQDPARRTLPAARELHIHGAQTAPTQLGLRSNLETATKYQAQPTVEGSFSVIPHTFTHGNDVKPMSLVHRAFDLQGAGPQTHYVNNSRDASNAPMRLQQHAMDVAIRQPAAATQENRGADATAFVRQSMFNDVAHESMATTAQDVSHGMDSRAGVHMVRMAFGDTLASPSPAVVSAGDKGRDANVATTRATPQLPDAPMHQVEPAAAYSSRDSTPVTYVKRDGPDVQTVHTTASAGDHGRDTAALRVAVARDSGHDFVMAPAAAQPPGHDAYALQLPNAQEMPMGMSNAGVALPHQGWRPNPSNLGDKRHRHEQVIHARAAAAHPSTYGLAAELRNTASVVQTRKRCAVNAEDARLQQSSQILNALLLQSGALQTTPRHHVELNATAYESDYASGTECA